MSEARRLLPTERKQYIIDLANKEGFVSVRELAELFRVSEVTTRKDFNELVEEGYLLRRRGGAIANTSTSLATAFEQRASLNLNEKRLIGRAAAELVNSSETIIIDAGTTTMEMAKSLKALGALTIVTNALNVAVQVATLPDVHVLQIGGSLSRETISVVGPLADRELHDIMVSKLFLGIHAVDLKAGLTDTSVEVAQTKRTMIRAARQVILLADSSKWERVAFAKIAPLSAVHTVVTDSGLSDSIRETVEALGIELVIV
jgi:DeoR/GlpR family transcriptional regulator of sugar metabolism